MSIKKAVILLLNSKTSSTVLSNGPISRAIVQPTRLTSQVLESGGIFFETSLSDSALHTDLFQRVVTYIRTFQEDVDTVDVYSITLGKSINDAITLGDSIAKDVIKGVSDSAESLDRTVLGMSKVRDDLFAVTERLTVVLSKVFNDSLSQLDQLSKDVEKSLSDTTDKFDTLSVEFSKILSDISDKVDITSLNLNKVLQDTLTQLDDTTKSFEKQLLDVSEHSETLEKAVSSVLQDTPINTESLALTLSKILSDVVTLSDNTLITRIKDNSSESVSTDTSSFVFEKLNLESVSLQDQFTSVVIYIRSFDENNVNSDESTLSVVKPFAEDVIINETAALSSGKDVQDSTQTSETEFKFELLKNLIDVSNVLEFLAFEVSKSLNENVSLTDVRRLSTQKVLSHSYSIADASNVTFGANKQEDVLLNDVNFFTLLKQTFDVSNQFEQKEVSTGKVTSDVLQLLEDINIAITNGLVNQVVINSSGSLISQGYTVDNTYFQEDYVGESRTFT